MPTSAQPQSTAPAPRGVIEPDDVNTKGVVCFLVVLIVVLAVCYVIVSALFHHLRKAAIARDRQIKSSEVAPSVMGNRLYFPPPHEQFSPQLDLQWFIAEQEKELNSYGWVDRNAGIVRVPIDRAMDLLLQRGLPIRSGSNASKTGPSSLELQQQRPVQSSPPQKEEGR